MIITRHDMPCDALGDRLSGGWPSIKGNAQANHASPSTATERGYRYASIHHAAMDCDGAAARSGAVGPRLATIGPAAGVSDALRELEQVKAERDALAAHIHQLDNVCRHLSRHCEDKHWRRMHELLEGGPTGSIALARLKAQAKAEAFENLANYEGHWTQADMRAIASDYRRQAEENSDE